MAKARVIERAKETDLTIVNAFEEFITEKSALKMADSTLRNYTQSVQYFIDYLRDSFWELDWSSPIEELERTHVIEYTNYIGVEKNANTINHYIRDLRAFLYWCMDDTRRYLKPFKVKQVKAQEESLKVYTDEEVAKLLKKPLATASFYEWRTWAIVNWVMATGNRGATICEVKLEDVDFETKHIYTLI